MDSEAPVKGERFIFLLDEQVSLAGTVRWVVRDRVGFAFDRPIEQDERTALLARARGYKGIEIYQLDA